MTNKDKCYHERRKNYDELENEETGEIIYGDFTICQDCGEPIEW